LEADVRVTPDLFRAGQLLKLEVLDHVVMGYGNIHLSDNQATSTHINPK